MIRVAVVGPDGAGKTSVVAEVQRRLGDRAVTLYLGLNPGSGGAVLPTTRLRERMRGATTPTAHRLAEAHRFAEPPKARPATGLAGLPPIRALRSVARLANRLAEASLLQARARRHRRAGRIVLTDRDTLLDYDATDVAPARMSLERRLHGRFLLALPRPDLVVLLDAPAEALFARKGEWSVAYLERRRGEYRSALRHVARSVIVDATGPLEGVAAEVTRLIEAELAARPARPSDGRRS